MNTISHEHEKFENTQGVIRIRKLEKYRKYNDQKGHKNKQWSTKYVTENQRLSNMHDLH